MTITEIAVAILAVLWPVTTGSIGWIFSRSIKRLDTICERVEGHTVDLAVLKVRAEEIQKRQNNHGERIGSMERIV